MQQKNVFFIQIFSTEMQNFFTGLLPENIVARRMGRFQVGQ